VTKDTIAITVSLFSLGIALVTLGWNIYREIALRGRIKTSLAIGDWHNDGVRSQKIIVSATNLGPGSVQLQGFTLKAQTRGKFNPKCHVPSVEWEHPLTTRLPAMLAVGETAKLVITYEPDCFLSGGVTQFGITDSFGRVHWTPKKDGLRAIEEFEKDFGLEANSPRNAT